MVRDDDLMNWLRRFMYGRYGQDELSIALLAITLIFTIILMFVPVFWIQLLALLPFGYHIFRMLSRNIPARHRENQWFLGWFRPILKWCSDRITMLKQSRNYRFFRCKGCGQTLRVPRKRGKIQIICPKCGASMLKKT